MHHRLPASRTLDRRDLLTMTVGSLGLSLFLPGLEPRAAARRGPERSRSLITLWLAGGASQLETWDPHPDTKIGGPETSIKTRLPGLEISSLYPRTADVIQELTVIRSLVSKEGDHARGLYMVKTGYRPDPTLTHPSLGAILTKELWDKSVEIPQHISLGGGPAPARGGFLGTRFDAFKVYEPGRGLQNLSASVQGPRQQRRLAGLDVVTRAFQRQRPVAKDRTQHQRIVRRARTMMKSQQLEAFKIERESQKTREAYGDTRFGRGCLVARRLVQQGVRAVEVTLPGWDSHVDNFTGHRTQAGTLDPALAALVRDLRDEDLLASTILLVIGEFGRTPTINPLDGRDHWPSGFSCLVGGGGLAGGRVLGQTDPEGKKRRPVDPVQVTDLYATILRQMGVAYDKEVITPIGRPMAYCEGTPLERLL